MKGLDNEMQEFAVLSWTIRLVIDLLELLEGESNLKPETVYVIGRLRKAIETMGMKELANAKK